jgi:glucose-6-phosphate isomerase
LTTFEQASLNRCNRELMRMQPLEDTPEWNALKALRPVIEGQSIRELFSHHPKRFEDYSLEVEGLLADFSKQPIAPPTRQALLALAEAREIEMQRDAMLAGKPINQSEHRAVLHTALRVPAGVSGWAGSEVAAEVDSTLTKMTALANAIRNGERRGATGKPIEQVISIGIGGSDLGPRLILEALAPWADGPPVHFVANVDGTELDHALAACDPERTLVLVISKSFGTPETMANAHEVMAWLRRRVPSDAVIAQQVLAVSANLERVQALGLDPALALPMWDWVGGRYSLWSAVGLGCMLSLGPSPFNELLAGAHAMDTHFARAPLPRNMPVMLGLCSVLNRSVLDRRSQAVVPYTERLGRLPAYLQQLVMESNGKSVDHAGYPIEHATSPLLWGQTGTPGQHAFFQALHQGSDVVPVDFIGVARPVAGEHGDALELSANLFAQSQALMDGRDGESVSAEQACAGNRPSTTLLLDQLSPARLGALIALYEHRTFVEAAIWGINAFDQFGVELGKGLAANLKPVIAGGKTAVGLDGSTAGLIARYQRWRG